MNRLCAIVLALIFAVSATAKTVPSYPPPPFTPPASHPRVYFMADDIARLKANAVKPENARAWAAHQAALAKGTDGRLPPAASGKTNADAGVLAIIESLAFDHVLTGNRESGLKAIAAMRQYAADAVYTKDDYNNNGQTVFTIGIVYDWCHDLLSKDDKEALHRAVETTAATMEIGWPPVRQGAVVGHGVEGQLQRDLMSPAIAMYDEYPELYNLVAGRFFAEFVAPKKFMYPSHRHNQGTNYTSYRHQWEILATWMFDRMGLHDVFGPDERYLPYWMIYARRPDGQIFADGDSHNANVPLYSYFSRPARMMFLAANYARDPYLKMEAMRERPEWGPDKPKQNQSLNPVEFLVFNDPDLAPRPLTELPNSHYFPSPSGSMVARTGWRDGIDSPDMVVEMKINEWYFQNHQHLDAGAFQIYYKGLLAIDSGYYQGANKGKDDRTTPGNTAYGSPHQMSWAKRSIAHNTISVFDPDEVITAKGRGAFEIVNDGGQRFPNGGREPLTHAEMMDPAAGDHIGTVLGHGFGPDPLRPDYTYQKGDLKNAYSSKMAGYERAFMFLNLKNDTHPGVLIVFDRVEAANKDFHKAWLLHGLEEPEVSAHRVVFRDSRPRFNGKLTVDTLLPAAADIVKIGGPGKEFWVAGKNYEAALDKEAFNEGGAWRVEVAPHTAAKTDYFLNVLQATDAKPDVAALPATAIHAATHEGVQIADRVVLFGKARDRLASPVAFSFSGKGVFTLLVADLKAGRWQATAPDGSSVTFEVPADSGVGEFRGSAGRWTLQPVTKS
jgi:hypothetical protein